MTVKINVMATAWEIARDGVKKFGGKVKEYFAMSLKMAWAKVRKMAKATLVTSSGSRKHKSWVARIVGTHARWGLDRKFVDAADENISEKYFELDAGYYEVCDAGERRFIVVAAGQIEEVSKSDVMAVVA